ncbi:hypothetical protein L13192_10073 [Pyrenophora tritici-repentis]|uniref:Uncharacterized protein n=2 Tax=Pyrenophora tritici-repentis TaxID=45151 RepID=A0A922NFT6_9PLEO|nr:uncharacterized protein PTRG_11865 [Pyrenophora tritici-repentis Pt-1C-BFP]EDU46021.1 predicted protein [Pyrenophora tritici-repentis Pt-1C-BFP]KAI1515168.1 hypothetical protein Ptr86124_006491 [Pyrenophora tritici-repentis]KAI1666389.1 hypothetical protein L13192_10073 [Pyrenophora tritici-repentis]KAI1679417.1 hypothetical protein KJE20_11599 [Pyrenophora tritici-repentis]
MSFSVFIAMGAILQAITASAEPKQTIDPPLTMPDFASFAPTVTTWPTDLMSLPDKVLNVFTVITGTHTTSTTVTSTTTLGARDIPSIHPHRVVGDETFEVKKCKPILEEGIERHKLDKNLVELTRLQLDDTVRVYEVAKAKLTELLVKTTQDWINTRVELDTLRKEYGVFPESQVAPKKPDGDKPNPVVFPTPPSDPHLFDLEYSIDSEDRWGKKRDLPTSVTPPSTLDEALALLYPGVLPAEYSFLLSSSTASSLSAPTHTVDAALALILTGILPVEWTPTAVSTTTMSTNTASMSTTSTSTTSTTSSSSSTTTTSPSANTASSAGSKLLKHFSTLHRLRRRKDEPKFDRYSRSWFQKDCLDQAACLQWFGAPCPLPVSRRSLPSHSNRIGANPLNHDPPKPNILSPLSSLDRLGIPAAINDLYDSQHNLLGHAAQIEATEEWISPIMPEDPEIVPTDPFFADFFGEDDMPEDKGPILSVDQLRWAHEFIWTAENGVRSHCIENVDCVAYLRQHCTRLTLDDGFMGQPEREWDNGNPYDWPLQVPGMPQDPELSIANGHRWNNFWIGQ